MATQKTNTTPLLRYYVAAASWDYDPVTHNQTSGRLSTWLARSRDLRKWTKAPTPLVAQHKAITLLHSSQLNWRALWCQSMETNGLPSGGARRSRGQEA